MEKTAQRRIVAIKPIDHKRGKGLTDNDRRGVRELAHKLKGKLLEGRTIIACAPTSCSQEMAHLFHCELNTVMPIPCRSLNSRRAHDPEPSNLRGLVTLVGGLIVDYENVLLITHVGDSTNFPLFASFFIENVLPVSSNNSQVLNKDGVTILDCTL